MTPSEMRVQVLTPSKPPRPVGKLAKKEENLEQLRTIMSMIVALRPAMGKEALRPPREEVPPDPRVVAPRTYTGRESEQCKEESAVDAVKLHRAPGSKLKDTFPLALSTLGGQPFLETALV